MVGATRNSQFDGSNGNGSQNPPPQNATEAFFVAQTALLTEIAQGQRQILQQGAPLPLPPAVARYDHFLNTQPPTFYEAKDPLDADAWVRSIESKFSVLVLPCSEGTKTRFATQLLRGPALLWWEHYCSMLP